MAFLRPSAPAGIVAAAVSFVSCLFCTSCSAASSGNDEAPAANGVASAPACAEGTFVLSGVVDSADRATTTEVGDYGFANVGNPSTLTAEFGAGGSLALEWNGTVSNGDAAKTSGVLTLPPVGDAAAEVLCVGTGSQIEPYGWGGKFLLAGLSHAPNADACGDSAAVTRAEGELLGCYGFKGQ